MHPSSVFCFCPSVSFPSFIIGFPFFMSPSLYLFPIYLLPDLPPFIPHFTYSPLYALRPYFPTRKRLQKREKFLFASLTPSPPQRIGCGSFRAGRRHPAVRPPPFGTGPFCPGRPSPSVSSVLPPVRSGPGRKRAFSRKSFSDSFGLFSQKVDKSEKNGYYIIV